MSAELLLPTARASDTNGNPYSGAIWRFYESGTSTPLAVYADAELTTSLGAVVTADSAGKFVPIYLDATKLYRAVLKDATGAVTLHDIDPINPSAVARDTISAVDYGINTTNSAAVNTLLFQAMWTEAAGRLCVIDAGTYRYEGTYTGVVNMRGAGMPSVNAARTALEGGTILLGGASFTGSSVILRDLGVDHGSAAFGTGSDALAVTANPYNSGRLALLQNVAGLGRNDSDAFHAVLVEGYSKATLSNVVGSTNQYCFAIKSRNVTFDSLHAIGGQNAFIFKSDGSSPGSGSLSNVVGTGLLVEGNANTDYGIRILAQNVSIDGVSISGVDIRNADYGVVIEAGAGTAVSNVTITDVVGKEIRNFGIQTGGAGAGYNFTFDNFNLVDLGDYAAQFQIGDVVLSNFYGSLKAGSTTHATTCIRAENTLAKFTAQGVKLVENFGAGASKPALYLALNPLLSRVSGLECGLEGTVPAFGGNGAVVSGATATITLLPDLDILASSTIVTETADATITTMSPVMPNTTTNVPVGYRWTVSNGSAFNLTLKNNSNIRPRAGADLVLTINQTASFIWLGSSWHQL